MSRVDTDDASFERPNGGPSQRGGQRGSARVPPHDLQAEESLLGAMMLDSQAIAAATGVVRSDDFYKPAHAHIFDAIHALYAVGEAVDPVTVADELRRNGLLDAVGGHQALVQIMSSTPATTNAAGYARIIQEHALLRKLIGVAGEIAEIGYSMPEDVTKALDRAESMVYDVNQRRVTDSTLKIEELLGLNLDRLEQLYGRGDAITGVPTGYVDLDDILSGLQPSNLIVVGARPSMGKALALDTPIPTPTGWTTMGQVRVGDKVFDEQGEQCTVIYVSPVQWQRSCYAVTFDDGSSLVADADHQWLSYDLAAWKSKRERHYRWHGGYSCKPDRNPNLARDQSSRWRQPRVVTTRQMLDEGIRAAADGRPNWYIPMAKPLDLPDCDLPVDPYVLGCWLGDGCSTSSQLTIGDDDASHFREEFAAAGYSLVHRNLLQYATVPVPGAGMWQGYHGPLRVLTRELQAVGLLGGARKHIPSSYMRASAKQRLSLLQGLLDTDGSVVNRNGTVELCLANPDLLQQAHELVCSLGHKPGRIRRKQIRLSDGRYATAWRFCWTPPEPVFRLPRKAERLRVRKGRRTFGVETRRVIRDIRPVESVPVRCISVDSPSHMYLAGETMVPTHNTSFGLGMAAHAALHEGRPVLVFSLEMSNLELSQRLLCGEGRIDSSRVRSGRLTEDDWSRISQAIGRLATAPIWIDDNPNLTVMEIRAKARRLKSQVGDLGMVVIDYLQLMTGRTNAENRQVEVSEISRGLKILARELECPVVALSQLSRQLELRADKRPLLADLRESGALEQDSDVVLFIYRDDVYHADSPDRGQAELIVAKHRNGPTGIVRLAFLEQYTRFANMARV
jgi:replicative DNA helicase